jgi:ATP-binding cassette subfamily F protein 3
LTSPVRRHFVGSAFGLNHKAGAAMPVDKPKFAKKKKVVAVSASTGQKLEKKKTTPQEYQAQLAKKRAAEKVEKAALEAKRKADLEAKELARAQELRDQSKTVDLLTGEETPKIIAACVARALNLPLAEGALPREVLQKAAAAMPEVALPGGADGAGGPAAIKSKLMVLAKVLAEAKKASKEKARQKEQKKAELREAEEAALQRLKAEEAAVKEEEAKAAAALVEAKLEAARAAMAQRTPEELAAAAAKHDKEGKAAKKDEEKAAKAQAKLAADVAAENAAVKGELDAAARQAATLRMDGHSTLTAINCGPFQLPNPGGGANLLEDASFTLAPGHRYAVIGRNGKGKSTLLRWLAARRVGELPPELSVHYVSQEVTLTEEEENSTPGTVVLAADVERTMLLAEVAAAEEDPGGVNSGLADRLQTVHERLDVIGAESAEARAQQLLVNLGFSDELRTRQMKNLSGGWRVRVALAAALFAAPDLLLLDEPTNHLSIDAVLWLQHELSNSERWADKMVAIVSHDRAFLDGACSDVLHISGHAKRLTQQRGSYTTWAKRRKEQQEAWEKKAKDRADQRQKMYDRANVGFRFGGSDMNKQEQLKKQIARSDEEKRIEDEELKALNEDEELPLKLCAGGALEKAVAQLKGVAFGYDAARPPLFQNVEMRIDGESRVVLMGENGNGKTTLVNVIMGLLEPTKGVVLRDAGARIVVVNQHHADQLDLSLTPLAFLKSKFPGDGSNAHDLALRSHLAGCGINADLQMRTGTALSGGQRSRVALAAVSYARPHVLVLDEPTNNLDLEAVAALADCVEAFDGGVVVVSHDQYFVGRVAKEVWVVDGGKVTKMESFASYTKGIKKHIKKRAEAADEKAAATGGSF